MAARHKARFALDSRLRAMIIGESERNFWRVHTYMDLDDLIAEGFLCYAKCRQRYSHAENYGHFMRLVRTCFVRRIHDLATQRTRERAAAAELLWSHPQFDLGLPSVATVAGQLSPELQRFVAVLVSGEVAASKTQRRGSYRETTDERYRRVAKVPQPRDADEPTLEERLLAALAPLDWEEALLDCLLRGPWKQASA